MRPPTPSRMWESFLKIGDHAPGRAPGEDVLYADSAAAREETLAVLRLYRDAVLPLVRQHVGAGAWDWYSFLIHDRESGVPLPEGDRGVYVHLRFSTVHDVARVTLPEPWEMTRRMSWQISSQASDDLDGWGWAILSKESELILDIVERLAPLGEEALIHGLGQALHYLSNMAQMVVN